ncbi:hypothetical protein TRVL_09381 [Trypanosoma vivax]|nr:hypothetical protein TRVL_09381 [Trypanosoma vivax]
MAFSPERSTRWDRRACVGRRHFSIFYPLGKRVARLVAGKAATGPCSSRSSLFPPRRFSPKARPAKEFRKSPAKIKRAALCREAWQCVPPLGDPWHRARVFAAWLWGFVAEGN